MPNFTLSDKSLAALDRVHPDLVAVVKRAIKLTAVDFRVTEGRRTIDRQRQLVAIGASRTLKSRHLTGHAVDVVALIAGQPRWDWPLYAKIAAAFKKAAKEKGTPIVWGGDWRTFKDGPHFELDPRHFPPPA